MATEEGRTRNEAELAEAAERRARRDAGGVNLRPIDSAPAPVAPTGTPETSGRVAVSTPEITGPQTTTSIDPLTGETRTGIRQDLLTTTPTGEQDQTPEQVSTTAERTERERGRSLLESETEARGEEASALGLEFFGEELAPEVSSLDVQIEEFTKRQEEQKELAEEVADVEKTTSEQQIEDIKERTSSEKAATREAFAVSREGPISGTAPTVSAKIQTKLQKNADIAIRRIQVAQLQRDSAMKGLAQAQKDQRSDLVARFQKDLDNAELEIERADTEHLNALTAQQSSQIQVQAANRANLETFQGLIDTGAELTTDSLIGVANSLNLPFETVNAYYEGSQAIRDDKNLSLIEKELKVTQLNEKVQDELRGVATKEAKKIDDYLQLSQSGQYTPEELQSFAVAMDIPVESNPVFQAELASKQAKAKIDRAEANGEFVNPSDYLDYVDKWYKTQETQGRTPGSVPDGGIYDIAQSGDGIQINVEVGQSIDNISTLRNEGYCGAFVNDVFGKRMMPDSFEGKMALTDPNIIIPEPGMAFVQSTNASYGHTGIVESVNAANGTMNIVDANWNGKGKIRRTTIPINDVDGFVRPPSATPLTDVAGGPGSKDRQLAEAIMDPTSSAKLSDLTATQKETVLPILNQLKGEAMASGDFFGVMAASAGGKDASDSFTQSISKANTVVNQIDVLSDLMTKGSIEDKDTGKSLDLGPLKGWIRKKNPWDTDAQKMQAILTGTVPNLARGVFGEVGVLTDHDIQLYMGTLPNLTQTEDVQKAVTGLTLRVVRDSIEDQIEIQAAAGRDMSGFANIYQKVNDQIDQIESELGIVDESRQQAQVEEEENPFGLDFIDTESSDDILSAF